MCYIEYETFQEISKDFKGNSLKLLKDEVKKFHLDGYIIFDYDDFEIIGFGDLVLKLNNNINLDGVKNYFEDFKYSKNHKLDYSNDIEVYSTYLFKDINGTEFYENKVNECIILKDSNNYNEFFYEIFMEELDYMLGGNLIDEISIDALYF